MQPTFALMSESEAETLATRLHRARLRRGYTVEQLHERSGVGISTIQRIEAGTTREPHDRTVLALGRALRVPADWLDDGRGGGLLGGEKGAATGGMIAGGGVLGSSLVAFLVSLLMFACPIEARASCHVRAPIPSKRTVMYARKADARRRRTSPNGRVL